MSSSRVRFVSILVAVWFALVGCTAAAAGPIDCSGLSDHAACTRVLFIGNSYTMVNDLPTVFARLAVSGGHRVEVGMAAVGGATFAQQVASADTLAKLAGSKWTFVVLQEQSQIPSAARSRAFEMYPSARSLVQRVRNAGATPVFFVTWGHRDGWPENGLADYASMQAQLDAGYRGIADELRVAAAPVGDAWAALRASEPSLVLWQDDGSHPTMAGTYLAAAVFYASLFHASPVGLNYSADLSGDTARAIQSAAASEVLNNPMGWLLP
jgi:hypothetical protein